MWAERARLEQLYLSNDWTSIARHVGRQAPGTRSLRIAPLYLRALGETGDLEQMWLTYGMLPASFRDLPLIRLQMAAYSGLGLVVERLLATELSSLRADQATVWRATSYQRAGQPTLAHQELSSPAERAAPTSRETERRREAPLSPARLGELSAEAQEIVEQFKGQAESEELAQDATVHRRRLWATTTLAVVLGVAYVLSASGGSKDLNNLVRWGALVVPLHLLGDHAAWRVVTAGLLHFGATHLAVNVLGLWLLGREVERLYNGRGLLAIFMGANVGAFALAAILVSATAEAPRVMLGASAGVMGLVGALLAFAAVGYLRAGHRWLGRQIVLLLAVVATQVLFDAFTPEVSSFLHLTGLGIGAAIGFGFSWSTFTRRSHS
jgi:membrane associated rhomboid family serine protease